jgi:hypothetical protein
VEGAAGAPVAAPGDAAAGGSAAPQGGATEGAKTAGQEAGADTKEGDAKGADDSSQGDAKAGADEPQEGDAQDGDGSDAEGSSDAKGEDKPQGDEKPKPDDAGKLASSLDPRKVIPAPRGPAGLRLLRTRVHGALRLRYRMRRTSSAQDHDLYENLSLHLGEETEPGLSASFDGRLSEDLDGRADAGRNFVFDSITDTYGSRVNGRVYHAYVNWRPLHGMIEQVRAGRQYVEGGDLFHLDGVRVDVRLPAGLEGGVYGGLPAHLFESTPEGDLLVGGFLQGHPWTGGQARLDVAYLQDRTRYYGDLQDVLTTVTVRHRATPTTNFWGALQFIDADPRMLRLNLDTYRPVQDVSFRAAFYGLLSTQNQHVTEEDPFYVIAESLRPYWTGSLAASKGFGRHVVLEGGVDLRRLFDHADAGRYNHSFSRYYGTISTDEWPFRHLYLSLTGERWVGAEDTWSAGFELEHRPSKRLRMILGTDYALYRFDLYSADERQSVRSYYVRVVYKLRDLWRLHARLRVEDDAFDTYVVLDTGVDLEF